MSRKNIIMIITSLCFILVFAYPHLGHAWHERYEVSPIKTEASPGSYIYKKESSIGINSTNKAKYIITLELATNKKSHDHKIEAKIKGYTVKLFEGDKEYGIKNIREDNKHGFKNGAIVEATGKTILTVTVPKEYRGKSFDRVKVIVTYNDGVILTNTFIYECFRKYPKLMRRYSIICSANKDMVGKNIVFTEKTPSLNEQIAFGVNFKNFVIEKATKEDGAYLLQLKNISNQDLYIQKVSLGKKVLSKNLENKKGTFLVLIKSGASLIMKYESPADSLTKNDEDSIAIVYKYSERGLTSTVNLAIPLQTWEWCAEWLSWAWENISYYSKNYWYVPAVAGTAFAIYVKPELLMFIPSVAQAVEKVKVDSYNAGFVDGFN